MSTETVIVEGASAASSPEAAQAAQDAANAAIAADEARAAADTVKREAEEATARAQHDAADRLTDYSARLMSVESLCRDNQTQLNRLEGSLSDQAGLLNTMAQALTNEPSGQAPAPEQVPVVVEPVTVQPEGPGSGEAPSPTPEESLPPVRRRHQRRWL